MNHDEHPNDSTLTQELRDSLSELAAPARPSLTAITSRGRAHQRRRLAGFASLGVAGVAAGAALAMSLTGVLGAAPARSTGSTDTIRTAAFTLTNNANGTDTLRLRQKVYLDPAALQRALAQHEIPALVKTGTFCSSTPEPHSNGGPALTTYPGPNAPASVRAKTMGQDYLYVINPAAIPAGDELFFGYFHTKSYNLLAYHLIDTSSYTCRNQQP
jgi:hypothetical protein